MQLFFHADVDTTTDLFYFDRQQSKHIIRVLRKTEGDFVYITNGKGWLFSAEITHANPNKCVTQIKDSSYTPAKNYQLHLAVAPTKNNDRYEWFLEKATEIGVSQITPIICEHSERKTVKIERFEKIIQAACKQSLQYHVPLIHPATSFSAFINQPNTDALFIAHCEDKDKKSLKQLLTPEQNYTILIGPEGDFSSKEITNALEKKYTPISLGNTRLRTETAAIVACHSVAFLQE